MQEQERGKAGPGLLEIGVPPGSTLSWTSPQVRVDRKSGERLLASGPGAPQIQAVYGSF